MVGLKEVAEGISMLQCCCRGVGRDRSVGAVQWLWGSVGKGVAVCDCMSLVTRGMGDGSVLLAWLPGESWTTLPAQKCPS